MYETPEDLRRLQALLDESHTAMTEHMRSILSPERRLSAEDLVEQLQGMKLLVLATVTSKGEPRVGPVDAFFFHGIFWFGSAPNSVRFRHIRKRPAVSATHLDGERLAVTVHGTAELIDVNAPEHSEFRDLCLDFYGETWNDWGATSQYARINPDRMYTYFSG